MNFMETIAVLTVTEPPVPASDPQKFTYRAQCQGKNRITGGQCWNVIRSQDPIEDPYYCPTHLETRYGDNPTAQVSTPQHLPTPQSTFLEKTSVQ